MYAVQKRGKILHNKTYRGYTF